MAPPQLLSRRFLMVLTLAVVFAAVVAVIAVVVLEAVEALTRLLWEELPDQLGVEPFGWWIFVPLLVGAVVVGVLAGRFPGRSGHEPSTTFGQGAAPPLFDVPVIVVVAVVSLAAGASLGPEAPLIAVTVALAPLVARSLPADDRGSVEASGTGSLVGGFLGAPLSAGVFSLEVSPLTGAALYAVTIPSLLGATVGLLVFRVLRGGAFAAYELPAYPGFEWSHVLMATAIGAAGGLFGRLLGAAHRVGHRLTRGLRGRPITLALCGAAVMGVVARTAGHETLFSGEHELSVTVADATQLGGGTLLALAAGKSVALLAASLTGFRGGLVFPLMFVGGVAGLALAEVAPDVPPSLAVGCGMAAAGVAAFRLPLFIVLFVAVFTGPELIPLMVIASLGAYVVVHDSPPWRPDTEGHRTHATT